MENLFNLVEKYEQIMYLKLFINTTNSIENNYLLHQYKTLVEKHNNKILTNKHPDAGFDLMSPIKLELEYPHHKAIKLDLHVKCAAYSLTFKQDELGINNLHFKPSSFYLYPRSSISKTPFRLANSVGIIDSGYRGNLITMIDILNYGPAIIEKYDRLFQICNPCNLNPIFVELVEKEDDLGVTERGEGGFGSTGR